MVDEYVKRKFPLASHEETSELEESVDPRENYVEDSPPNVKE